MGPITSKGRESTVTERAARSNPQRAVGEAHCELCVTQKVIDAHLKALSTPWWTESSKAYPTMLFGILTHFIILLSPPVNDGWYIFNHSMLWTRGGAIL